MMSRTWGEDVECAPIAHVQYVDEILTGVKNKLCILDVSTQHEKILMPCKTHLFEAPVRLLGKLPGSMGDSRNAVPGLYIHHTVVVLPFRGARMRLFERSL